jgi:hypothetical protein
LSISPMDGRARHAMQRVGHGDGCGRHRQPALGFMTMGCGSSARAGLFGILTYDQRVAPIQCHLYRTIRTSAF